MCLHKTILISLLFFFKSYFFSQNNILVSHTIEQRLPAVFTKNDQKTFGYKNEGVYHFSEILFFSDSSFVYYFLSPSKYDFTVGKYTYVDHLITLNWDSVKTYNNARDTSFYGKFFRLKKPCPFKIKNLFYQLKPHTLEKVKIRFPNKKNIIYPSFDSYLTEGIIIDSIVRIQYNSIGDKLIIKTKYKKNDMVLSKDSVWGYRTCPDWNCNLYRIAPKGLNWYGPAGIQLIQIDDLIIYTIGSGHTYSCFSKTLRSKIYPLNRSGITEAFKDNKDLLVLLLKEGDKLPNYWAINEATDSYRIIEIYRDALKKITGN